MPGCSRPRPGISHTPCSAERCVRTSPDTVRHAADTRGTAPFRRAAASIARGRLPHARTGGRTPAPPDTQKQAHRNNRPPSPPTELPRSIARVSRPAALPVSGMRHHASICNELPPAAGAEPVRTSKQSGEGTLPALRALRSSPGAGSRSGSRRDRRGTSGMRVRRVLPSAQTAADRWPASRYQRPVPTVSGPY
jgi:hypothetical protein